MTETTVQKKARKLAEGARSLLDELPGEYGTGLAAEDLIVPRELLTMATLLLDGKDEAREKKNAGDRARRDRAKTAPRKPKRKYPPLPKAARTDPVLDKF